jgi:CDGSH-type Zn-finger protein
MADESRFIEVRPDGPYLVRGGVPLVRKAPIVSEHGEPLAWRKEAGLEGGETYALCRCGQSASKPFCDGSHARVGFDGTETAPTSPTADRSAVYPGTNLEMRDDRSLCIHAGFCTNRATDAWKMVEQTADSRVRAELMAMIDRCPSGARRYALGAGERDVEPDLPAQIALVPDGPLWVTGSVEVRRADARPLERRNRVALCRCGASGNKPLCDGSHAKVGFRAE